MKKIHLLFFLLLSIFLGCSKKNGGSDPVIPPTPNLNFNALTVNGIFAGFNYTGINTLPIVKISFSAALKVNSATISVILKDKSANNVAVNISFENNDSTIVIQPSSPLQNLAKYTLSVSTSLQSSSGAYLLSGIDVNLSTSFDNTYKFPSITDDALLTLVQKQTFKYFWDFAHPVSGLARERSNGDNEVVTTGGSGFGIMAIPVAIERNFITRAEGLVRMQKIVSFLSTKPPRFHGAFSHWMNGTTGAVVPFGADDNGADIVETSYLMAGLLTVRQYFNGTAADETVLRDSINSLYRTVDWNWFRQGGKKVLYWNWSPDKGWAVNVPVQGWNECLITYVMAASSPTHPISKDVYDSGFARNGSIINGNAYYGYQLPLGPAFGGPLFFSHYSFLGIDPNGLSDYYANYATQTKNHTLINYNYCKQNPQKYYGYSDSCWGLTASDIQGGYAASSPANDVGVIAPTAALSSFPYTPDESMKALHFYYYLLGDKIWREYGFTDAFSLQTFWYADSYLAIDQGPVIVMIENYRSRLIWNLFTGCPEIKSGMRTLGFSAAYL